MQVSYIPRLVPYWIKSARHDFGGVCTEGLHDIGAVKLHSCKYIYMQTSAAVVAVEVVNKHA
jgi:hypothetical protein